MKNRLVCLVVLLAMLIHLSTVTAVYAVEKTNRTQVRDEFSTGWDGIVWGDLINEADYLEFVEAVAKAVASENPAPILQYFSQQAEAQITALGKSALDLDREELMDLLISAFKSKGKTLHKGDFEISAGLATYRRWNPVIYDEPRTYKCKWKKAGISMDGFCTTTVQVTRDVPLPNNFEPYIRFRKPQKQVTELPESTPVLKSPSDAGWDDASLTTGDFNGDGFADLVVGVPGEDIETKADAGAVNIFYGSSKGISVAGNHTLSQDTDSVAGTAEAGDLFGSSLTSGDFNKDGFTDLAVGVPGEDIETKADAGAVNIFYGSSKGISVAGNHTLSQDTDGVAGTAEASNFFGQSVAAGDFNGDGFADLVVGVSGEDIGQLGGAGAVNLFYGSSEGISVAGNYVLHQDTGGMAGVAEPQDLFGRAVTAGDFNFDGYTDLTVGIPGEDIRKVASAGAVHLLYGFTTGIITETVKISSTYAIPPNDIISQSTDGVVGAAEISNFMGSSLTTGDFNGDGFADLVVGVPGEDIGQKVNAGAVNIFYGSASGISVAGNLGLNQDTDGVVGQAEAGDLFGGSLTAGDFNNDGFADLAVGEPGEDIEQTADAGAVNVFYGSASGISVSGNLGLNQDTDGVAGAAEAGDLFGGSLTSGDFNKDGFADLVVGVSGEDIEQIADAGAVNIFYGSASGISVSGNHTLSQGTDGVSGAPEKGDRFGAVKRDIPF